MPMTTSVSGKVDALVRRTTAADIAETLSRDPCRFQAMPMSSS